VSAVVHIAGHQAQVGPHLRQRCAWCGEILEDHDLRRIAVPVGQDPRPGLWAPGVLVLIDGGLAVAVDHNDGDDVPGNCCAALDPAATRLCGWRSPTG
jgi:hypothetical protein